ncbi:hypothetical protein RKD49_002841 [Streptomyces glaucescens]
MLRNLNVEFRGNELPDEPYSRLVRHGAVTLMKNACTPSSEDVRIRTPRRAAEAAAAIGAGAAERLGALGVRVVGDPALLSAVPDPVEVRHTTPAKARTVHQTSSKDLVRVLGRRCLKGLRRR